MPRLFSTLLLSLMVASSASAVTMAWTPIGNPGNACDPQVQGCFGAVGHYYSIGTYEVTNAQYAEFLNAKAASDPLALYNNSMGSGTGGITRTGVSGSFSYSAIAGRGDMPVTLVSFYDALRFANWMNNGQGTGDTETGAYTLIGGSPEPTNGNTVTRNVEATIFLSSEDEWYKAAYYDAGSASYFDYPTGTNTQTVCAPPTATSNRANCNAIALGDLTIVGGYPGSPSPYGTFDQGGNVQEWNEAIINDFTILRGVRGGRYASSAGSLNGSARSFGIPTQESDGSGFRLAMIVPEPGSGLLVIAGLLGLAGWRREAARRDG